MFDRVLNTSLVYQSTLPLYLRMLYLQIYLSFSNGTKHLISVKSKSRKSLFKLIYRRFSDDFNVYKTGILL